MNLIILYKNDFIDGTHIARLKDRRFKHIREIHKPKVQESLNVGLIDGKMGQGKVVKIAEDHVDLDVSLRANPPKSIDAIVAIALPRPIMLKRILSYVTSIGIKKIILFNSQRVEKSFWQSSVLKQENLTKYLIEGLEQAKDTILPEVLLRPFFKSFVKNDVTQLLKKTNVFVAHPEASKRCPSKIKNPATILIGPEGGFIPSEIKSLIDCGVESVNLGKRILKVETATYVVLSKLL
ncbi:MAG: 16S rRNA (uracil(1498)-N(3))-methyltransferase [Candidatus Zapsychrus exili]|nr:16S rRNA (uracil(1498)-N(3))-methyltransferase [Candidatus Zapsychrus exili]